LGVAPEAIRAAILQHAANAASRQERVDVPVLKKTGLDLGILHADDLPEVTIPRELTRSP
jgi:hypothetical protein